MVDSKKINIGHKKVKQLEGGIYENLALLRKALNELCEENKIELPESLAKLNEVFDGN